MNSNFFYEGDAKDSFCWEIKGDTAQQWTSGLVNYKARIVEKDGKIYFEGYKWRTLLDILFRGGKEQGFTYDYIVEYNMEENSIALILIKDS